jgi:hypothetical protein
LAGKWLKWKEMLQDKLPRGETVKSVLEKSDETESVCKMVKKSEQQ